MDILEQISQDEPGIQRTPRSSLSDKSFLQVRDMFPNLPIHHYSNIPG
jgi:hypothetical protein